MASVAESRVDKDRDKDREIDRLRGLLVVSNRGVSYWKESYERTIGYVSDEAKRANKIQEELDKYRDTIASSLVGLRELMVVHYDAAVRQLDAIYGAYAAPQSVQKKLVNSSSREHSNAE